MPDIGFDQQNGLIAALYEAGLDSAKWSVFCERLGDALGEDVRIHLQGHDLTTRSNLDMLTANYDPDFLEKYKAHYASINAWLPALANVPVGRVFTDLDLLEREELIKTEFWADYIRPLDDMAAFAAIA